MFLLSKENITEYLKGRMPELDYSKPLLVSEVGEGTAEEDGDGFINFVYRVSDGKKKLILKQARSEGRIAEFTDMSLDRASIEYDHMKIGRAIAPEYFPELYFYDKENLVFAVEDVSYLKISRFQLNKSIMFPDMAKHIATYLAKMHFYTSDYYLETEKFRDLQIHFMNHKMRDVFDLGAFLSCEAGSGKVGIEIDETYAEYIRDLVLDPRVVLERYKLRDLYMRKAEVLLHADFHTSNIFIGQDGMKVIDMEYTFFGPAAYDLGYLQSHLLSQYVCAGFREFATERERKEFQCYILASMQQIFEEYCNQFFTYWNQDAKPVYQGIEGLQDLVKKTLLSDMIGYIATSNIFRCAAPIGYPEYDDLDEDSKRHAIVLSLLMDHRVILKRSEYASMDEFIDELIEMEREYKRGCCKTV